MTAEAAIRVKITLTKYIVTVVVVFELLDLKEWLMKIDVFGLSMA